MSLMGDAESCSIRLTHIFGVLALVQDRLVPCAVFARIVLMQVPSAVATDRWAKRFAFALVIGRSVGRDFAVGRTVDRVAMEVAGVFDAIPAASNWCSSPRPVTGMRAKTKNPSIGRRRRTGFWKNSGSIR